MKFSSLLICALIIGVVFISGCGELPKIGPGQTDAGSNASPSPNGQPNGANNEQIPSPPALPTEDE